jgi:hypothetical protein
MQRHSVNVFIDGELGDNRFKRNALFDYPVRKRSDQDAFIGWSGILWADITLYIGTGWYNLQQFRNFFANLHTPLGRFRWLDHDIFSSEFFRKGDTSGTFGSFLW